MKVLVTAASKLDATGQIARTIGEVLRSRGLAATVARPEDVRRVDRYDAVIVGSAVYSGQWLRPARKFVARAGAALNGRPVWTFSASLDGSSSTLPAGSLRSRGHCAFARSTEASTAVRDWANEIADQLTVSAAA